MPGDPLPKLPSPAWSGEGMGEGFSFPTPGETRHPTGKTSGGMARRSLRPPGVFHCEPTWPEAKKRAKHFHSSEAARGFAFPA
jgi:hypothetical protein